MSTIITRAGKGSPLTNTELDANFTNLNTDKLEVATAASTYQPLDGDLTAIAALASTGYAKRTGTSTWSVSATISGADITGAIDGVTVGVTTPAAGRFTSLLVNASAFLSTEVVRVIGDVSLSSRIGVLGPYTADNLVSIGPGTHPGTDTSVLVVSASVTAPATATTKMVGYSSKLASTAAAYTLGSVWNFVADTGTVGAGSTIANAIGFYARSTMAVGTNNYGFYSDISSAANTYQMFLIGSAANYIGSYLLIGTSSLSGSEKLRVAGITNTDSLVVSTLATINPSSVSTMDNVTIGTTTSSFARFTYASVGGAADNRFSMLLRAPPTTGTTITAISAAMTGLTTATSGINGFYSNLATTASAYTCSAINHFYAIATSKGAGSTITSVYGLRVDSGAMTGSANYGAYLDVPFGATNYGVYSAGNAKSYFNGHIGVRGTPDDNYVVYVGTPLGTGTSVGGVYGSIAGGTTATTSIIGFTSAISNVAAAYTTSLVAHFQAYNFAKGAGSIVTDCIGFYANASAFDGNTNIAFYSTLSAAASNYAVYFNGTAQSYFGGNINLATSATLGFGTSATPDTILVRDSANVLAMKNSTTAQTLRVYGTTTGPKYLSLSHDGTNAIVDTNASGGRLSLGGNASSIFGLSNLLFTDNSFDIGASGANRPRSAYFSASVTAATSFIVGSNQVVGARDTGWSAMTGTANEATVYDTATVTLAQLAGRVMALQAALTTHGLIGA